MRIGWTRPRGFGNEVTYASALSLCDDLHDRLQNRIGVAGKVRGVLIARLGRNLTLEGRRSED